MKLDVSKRAYRNILFGFILKIYQIIVPFIMRTIMIYYLGIEYAGSGGLFASVMQMLNLAEMGVGTAIVFFMYKPIAQDDYETVRGLISLFREYYRKIGAFILIIGIIATPLISFVVSKDVPGDINIYAIYLMNLLATVACEKCF